MTVMTMLFAFTIYAFMNMLDNATARKRGMDAAVDLLYVIGGVVAITVFMADYL